VRLVFRVKTTAGFRMVTTAIQVTRRSAAAPCSVDDVIITALRPELVGDFERCSRAV